MVEIIVSFIQGNSPVFFSVLAIIPFYLLLNVVFEEAKWLNEWFFLILLLLIVPDLFEIFNMVQSLVALIVAVMLSLVPIVSTILLILQGIIAFISLNPFVLLLVQWILFLVDKLFLPALAIAVLLDIWSRALPTISFSRTAQFIRSGLIVSIGTLMLTLTMMFTVSTTLIISLNETVSTPLKRMLEQSIPIIGSVIVQALSVVKKSQMITSSTLGAAAILSMMALLALPLFFLIGKAILYKVLAMICEPFLPEKLTGLLDDVSRSLFIICGIVAIVFSSIVLIIIFILLCSYFVTGSV